MKKKLAVVFLLAGWLSTLSGLPALSQEEQSERIQFACREDYAPRIGRRVPTTFAFNSQGKVAVIRWQSGNNPDKRCRSVSARFQRYAKNGGLQVITHGIMNRQKVICVTPYRGGSCNRLLFTLNEQDNPEAILDHLLQILNGRKVDVIHQNSGNPHRYLELDLNASPQGAVLPLESKASKFQLPASENEQAN